MTTRETLDFIHSVNWIGSKPGLSRTEELLKKLGNPQKRCAFVHVAGTNGKGSTSSMLASILTAAGYKTGLYTSPYLFHFNERMRIDGVPIPDEELSEVTEKIKPLAIEMEDSPTEFELVTAIAFEWFAQKECDIVVLEVGMGGRLDSTNVIDCPECAVITNIGLDHTKELGSTLPLIAAEKAGIIKTGGSVVLYQQTAEVTEVVERVCKERGCNLKVCDFSAIRKISDSRLGQKFRYKNSDELGISLLGEHQLKNASVVLEAVEVLHQNGREISDEAIKEGLANSVWPARFEIISQKPWFVVDGGHNPQCAETVAANLKNYFPNMKTILMVGVLRDKDYAGLIDILDSVADGYVTVTPDSPRALPAGEFAKFLERYGKPVKAYSSIDEGIAASIELAGADGVVCSVGSLYTAGKVRAYFGLM